MSERLDFAGLTLQQRLETLKQESAARGSLIVPPDVENRTNGSGLIGWARFNQLDSLPTIETSPFTWNLTAGGAVVGRMIGHSINPEADQVRALYVRRGGRELPSFIKERVDTKASIGYMPPEFQSLKGKRFYIAPEPPTLVEQVCLGVSLLRAQADVLVDKGKSSAKEAVVESLTTLKNKIGGWFGRGRQRAERMGYGSSSMLQPQGFVARSYSFA